jgi:hypothetical protein
MQIKKQNPPAWMSPRPKTQGQLRQIFAPEFIFPDWEINQWERLPSNPPPNPTFSKTNVIRRHSAR